MREIKLYQRRGNKVEKRYSKAKTYDALILKKDCGSNIFIIYLFLLRNGRILTILGRRHFGGTSRKRYHIACTENTMVIAESNRS